MKNKLILFGFIILLVALGVFAFLYFDTNNRLNEAEYKYDLQRKKELEEIEKKYEQRLDEAHDRYIELNDKLILEEQNIKYISYEKLLYTDRTVNAALDTISKYKFNSGTEKKKR